jgi:membrane dipeptidase
MTLRLYAILATVFLVVSASAQSAPKKPAVDAHAIHSSALIVDTHVDTPQYFDKTFNLASGALADGRHFDLDLARKGNVGAEFMSIWPDAKRYKGRYAKRALDLIDATLYQVAKNPDRAMMAFSTADIMKARAASPPKLAVLMGVEGGHAIENDLSMLRNFYRLGVRYMTLTWSNTNEWADSSGDLNDEDVKHHNGLTEFGEDVVREMNRMGMIVDISHVSDKTFYRTLTITRAPVIASHSSARALNSHARNMSDDMLRAVGVNGGVVMVNFYSAFIDEDFRKAYGGLKKERDAAEAELKEKLTGADDVTYYRETNDLAKESAQRVPRPALKVLIDHIDHIAKVAGVDHVGLGSDFDGVDSLPAGIDSVADLPKITQALVERGYTREQIHKILGGNFMRAFREVERVSREIKAEEAAKPPVKK